MLLFIICIIAAVFMFFIFMNSDGDSLICLLSMLGLYGFFAADIIMAACLINIEINADAKAAAYQQRYDSIVYQLDNNLYDNDNDVGKKELYDQIQAWNEELAEKKVMRNNIWIRVFYPDFYDDLEFIPLE